MVYWAQHSLPQVADYHQVLLTHVLVLSSTDEDKEAVRVFCPDLNSRTSANWNVDAPMEPLVRRGTNRRTCIKTGRKQDAQHMDLYGGLCDMPKTPFPARIDLRIRSIAPCEVHEASPPTVVPAATPKRLDAVFSFLYSVHDTREPTVRPRWLNTVIIGLRIVINVG